MEAIPQGKKKEKIIGVEGYISAIGTATQDRPAEIK